MRDSHQAGKENGFYLGKANNKPVFLSESQLNAHIHISGASGSGKSKFIELMLRQAMGKKSGFALLDPHGSLVTNLIEYVAKYRPSLAKKIIVFRPAESSDSIVGFSPLPRDAHQNLDYVLESNTSAILKGWGQDSSDLTPRITRYLQNFLYVLIHNKVSYVEAQPLMSVSKRAQPFQEMLLRNVRNHTVYDDFQAFWSSTLTQKQNLVEGASNRLRKFLRNESMRLILGQREKALNLRKIMDEGKILLVDLNGRDKIAPESMELLGTLLVNEFFRSAIQRNPANPRLKPFYLFIDEFAQFVSRDIARMLDQTRKFGLYCRLANQHLGQLENEDEFIYNSVMTNCQIKVVFGGLSTPDAEVMVGEMYPHFLDLKTIKHDLFTTKVHHEEETRNVKSVSTSETEGTGESQTKSSSNSRGTSEAKTFSESESEQQTIGFSIAHGESSANGKTTGRAKTHSVGNGKTISETKSRMQGTNIGIAIGENSGTSSSEGGSVVHSESETETQGFAETEGSSHSESKSHSTNFGQTQSTASTAGGSKSKGNSTHVSSMSVPSSQSSSSETQQYSQTSGSAVHSGYSDTEGWSKGRSKSRTNSSSKSKGWGRAFASNWSHGSYQGVSKTKTTGESNGTGESEGIALSEQSGMSQMVSESQTTTKARSKVETRQESRGTSRQKGKAETVSHSETQTEGEGSTVSKNSAKSTGQTMSEVPFLAPKEYQELSSRTFWSKDELLFQAMGALKNQKCGHAILKVGETNPVSLKVAYVPSNNDHPVRSQNRILRFMQRVKQFHPEVYLSREEARRKIEDRQMKVFGTVLQFDETSNEDESRTVTGNELHLDFDTSPFN